MHKDNPGERAWQRQHAAKQPYIDSRNTYSEKNAKLEREASAQEGPQRNLSEEERKALLEQHAEENFKEIGEERAEELDSTE